MENIIFEKCKENIEMYSTTNQIFKEKYLLALNNIEENFSNYPSLEDLLQEMYKLSIYGVQQMIDPKMEERMKIRLLTKMSKTTSANDMDEYLKELKSLNGLLIDTINKYYGLRKRTGHLLFGAINLKY